MRLQCNLRVIDTIRLEKTTLKPQPKHPIKLHVWAGISRKAPTLVAIFEGIVDAEFTFHCCERISFLSSDTTTKAELVLGINYTSLGHSGCHKM